MIRLAIACARAERLSIEDIAVRFQIVENATKLLARRRRKAERKVLERESTHVFL